MQKLYEHLQKRKLIHPADVYKKIFSLKETELIDLLGELFALSNTTDEDIEEGNVFDFTASYSLGGIDFPCMHTDCRLRRLNELLTFSIMYSNSILLPNPFDYVYSLLSSHHQKLKPDMARIREKTAGSILAILLMERPIKEGFVKVNRTVHLRCEHCSKIWHKQNRIIEDKMWDIADKKIIPEMIINTKVLMDTDHSIVIEGSEAYAPDIMTYSFYKPPIRLPKWTGKPSYIDWHLIKDYWPAKLIISNSIESLMMQKYDRAEGGRSSYLTNNPTESKLINAMRGSNRALPNLTNFFKSLIHELPFITEISQIDLMKIRKSDEDVFIRYRESLLGIIKKIDANTSIQECSDLVKEKVVPQVVNIEKLLIKRSSELSSFGIKTVIPAGISMGVGIATFFTDPVPAVQKIGVGLTMATNYISKEIKLSKDIRARDYYFLWKVKEQTT